MWASRQVILTLAVIAAGLAGCAANLAPRQIAAASADHDARELTDAVALAVNLKYDQSAAILERLLPRLHAYGQTDQAAEATFWLAFSREKQGRASEAAELYRRVTQLYGGTSAAAQARLRLGRLEKSSGTGVTTAPRP